MKPDGHLYVLKAGHVIDILRTKYPARDGEDLAVCSNGGEWLTAWHAPDSVPHGTPHGANGSVSLVTIKSC